MQLIKDAYNDIERKQLPIQEGIAGQDDLRNTAAMQVGFGSRVMRMDQDGMWLGAETFAAAPFSVDMDGNVIANAIELASSVTVSSANGINQVFTASESTVTGSTTNFTLTVQSLVHVIVTAHGHIEQGGAGDFFGNGLIRLYVDGADSRRAIISGGVIGTEYKGATGLTSSATSGIFTLSAASHTIELSGSCDSTTGTAQHTLYNYTLSIITVGAIF